MLNVMGSQVHILCSILSLSEEEFNDKKRWAVPLQPHMHGRNVRMACLAPWHGTCMMQPSKNKSEKEGLNGDNNTAVISIAIT